ncbi:aminotransferase class I/II-fold pyridoxal phosphate-dependent enzyme [Clostridium swellfunianum]|uniref:aminotransferase class I/II-fold pyridoxal phosphate-dependent enzyme n=1 Tax=Clostridium swellfunianum TaxID=1367462 RepID=UPI002030B31F|nr:aminotransferase class I/II-fold pyridoxal phosphate-dependent enzyme [Clostridium swellfunianum]MCM0646955.1 aminotransferase class I/II-fold pyridoxal phosphate-dependent enzyme [Clostridium swellfunianum]
MADIFEKCFNYNDAKEAIKAGIYPYFHALTSGQDTEVIIGGKRVIMLGSNNYLGLTSDPRLKEAAIKAVEKYGSGCSGSRFLNGTLDLHIELEERLAAFVKKEAALVFSTGFQTNLGIISAIAGRNDYIIGDKQNHASLVDACRLSFAKFLKFKHNDMEDLERILKSIPEDKGRLIVVDGVFSMEGDIANLPEIVRLAKQYGARVMVDDAHGLGVMGEYGRGTAEYFGLEDEVDIIMGTFSKSLASLGGYVASKEDVVDYIKHHSRPFIFSASIPPASAAAAMAALDILQKEPERIKRLWDNAKFMKESFEAIGLPVGETRTPIVPIIAGEDFKAFKLTMMLLEEGVYVNPAVAPAVEPGCALLRTSYTPTHTKEQLEFALGAFEKVFKASEQTA